MRLRLGTIRKLIRETFEVGKDGTYDFTFNVYDSDGEAYTVFANYNPRLPLGVEVYAAQDATGAEVDVDHLGREHDLHAMAMEEVEKHLGGSGDPNEMPDYDDIHGKPGIDY